MEVRDHINAALAGHDGCAYTSPPQPRQHALELVALLLGRPSHLIADGRGKWTTAVAGGRRSITLTDA